MTPPIRPKKVGRNGSNFHWSLWLATHRKIRRRSHRGLGLRWSRGSVRLGRGITYRSLGKHGVLGTWWSHRNPGNFDWNIVWFAHRHIVRFADWKLIRFTDRHVVGLATGHVPRLAIGVSVRNTVRLAALGKIIRLAAGNIGGS